MIDRDDYIKARERMPEPKSYDGDRYCFAIPPTPIARWDFDPAIEDTMETGEFEKRLCVSEGGARFWAWTVNGEVFF